MQALRALDGLDAGATAAGVSATDRRSCFDLAVRARAQLDVLIEVLRR